MPFVGGAPYQPGESPAYGTPIVVDSEEPGEIAITCVEGRHRSSMRQMRQALVETLAETFIGTLQDLSNAGQIGSPKEDSPNRDPEIGCPK